MEKKPVGTTFSIKNYFRPTPTNIMQWSEGAQGLIVTVVSSSWAAGANTHVLLSLMIASYMLDKVSKFFGRVAHDMEEIKIEVPSSVADQVTITQEPVNDENKSA